MAKHTGHTITSDSALGSAVIQRSLRFHDGDSANLTRTSSSTSTTFTYSAWIKRCTFTGYQYIFSLGSKGFSFHSSNNTFYLYDGSALNESTAIFRDPSAWYHIVVQINSGVATSYVNGVLVHNAVGSGFTFTTGTNETRIGVYASGDYYFDGYQAEINLVDGSVVAPTSFGFTDPVTGIWMPKRYEGTYGTNGFYLDFSDNTSTTTLGIDKSPNGNDFTSNNFSVSSGLGNDSFEDTPTNNFPTLNPTHAFLNGSSSTAENGNLQWNGQSNNQAGCPASMAFPTTGKWYWEVKLLSSNANFSFGITPVTYSNVTNPANPTGSIGYAAYGSKIVSGSETSSWAASFSNSDTAAAALDMDSKKITFYKNNSAVGSIDLVSGKENVEYLAWIKGDTASQLIQGAINFGGNGFVYTPPTGYKALNSNNLVPHSPSIIKPQKHFNTLLWNGNASAGHNITGLEFTPDFVWIKKRSGGSARSHQMFDVIRGVHKTLHTDLTDAEDENTNRLSAFNQGGFTVNNDDGCNGSGSTNVAWCWKAGGAAVTNSDGTVSGNVSANPEAGFSIVQYTGSGGHVTRGHGLGKKPQLIIYRRYSESGDWFVNLDDSALPELGKDREYLRLNTTGAVEGANGNISPSVAPDNSAAITDTIYSIGGDLNESGKSYINYLWTSIPGYSKIGGYTGNASTDGPFIHTGFRPAWVMWKNVDASTVWIIFDSVRETFNFMDAQLRPNENMAENVAGSSYSMDFLSNGFKVRSSDSNFNGSGNKILYMAFAEQPGTTPFDTFTNAR